MTKRKNQFSDLSKLIKNSLNPSYLDTKDDLPKRIGIIGDKYNVCYFAAIELVFKLVKYRSKIRNYIIKDAKTSIEEFEREILLGNAEYEKKFTKYFELVYCDTLYEFTDSLNTGSIDYGVLPSKILNTKSHDIKILNQFNDFIESTDVILSASIVKNTDRLVLCSHCDLDKIECIHTTDLNFSICRTSLEHIFPDNNLPVQDFQRHTKLCFLENSRNKENSAFICNEFFLNNNLADPTLKTWSINFENHLIEFRLLKTKSFKKKDDYAKPQSLHRRYKQCIYLLWRHNSLKTILSITISIILYLYSLAVVHKIKSFTLLNSIIEIQPKQLISTIFSIIIFGVFYIMHIRIKTRMRLKKIKGYWLLYTRLTNSSGTFNTKNPYLYDLPRIAKIGYSSNKKHLLFEIYNLSNDVLYLKSEDFYLDVVDLNKAHIVVTYSNNDLPESHKINGPIKGIAKLECSIIFESGNVYEMVGNFFSKTRLEVGLLKYFRLSDKEDFDLLKNSEFIKRENISRGKNIKQSNIGITALANIPIQGNPSTITNHEVHSSLKRQEDYLKKRIRLKNKTVLLNNNKIVKLKDCPSKFTIVNGKTLSIGQYIETLQKILSGIFNSKQELYNKWSHSESRLEIISKLLEKGINLKQIGDLIDLMHIERCDVYDIFKLVGFLEFPVSLRERANNALLFISSSCSNEQKKLFDFILSQYLLIGNESLEEKKFIEYIHLNYHDLSKMEVELGDIKSVKMTFNEMQKHLYL